MSNIEQLLMDKKMKRTKARVLILKTLAKGLPLSAGEVFEAVRVKDTQLSLSTVYRNCEALAEHGLLSRSTTMSDGLTRYEFDHGTPVPHAICTSCHRIFPIDIHLEEGYKEKLSQEYGFATADPRIEIYGLCKDCKKGTGE